MLCALRVAYASEVRYYYPMGGTRTVIPSSAAPFTGGLILRLLRRVGVQDATLQRIKIAAIFAVPLLAWAPLFALSAIDGKAIPGSAGTPFLLDLSAHIRLLVALPLFLLAGLVAEVRILPTLKQFLTRQLIPEDSMERFRAAVESAFRLGDSILADLVIIAVIYTLDALVWHSDAVRNAAWYSGSPGQPSNLTPAGVYYAYVSLPIFQFILFRWYYRLFIWARFLAQVSKLKLHLVPTHPDRLGGLGFLLTSAQAFTVFALANGVLLAGWLSTRVVTRGAGLLSFKEEIIGVPIFIICVCIAPFLMFTQRLVLTKRLGIQEYGALASRYAREFDDKWVSGTDCSEPLVGSSDIQSLADMGGSYDIVQSMRSVAITPQMIVAFAIVTLLPVAPLLLTLMPFSEIVKKIAGILF
jgi:hypothetical protein